MQATYAGAVYRFLLSWRWAGLAALAVLLAVTFTLLGFWQLGRYHASESRDGPLPLSVLATAGEPLTDRGAGRIVAVSGSWIGAAQRLVPGDDGRGRAGLRVVTPLADSSGSVIRVVRGWVPAGTADVSAPRGQVEVRGVLQQGPTDAPAVPDVPGFSLYPGQVVLSGAVPPTGRIAPIPVRGIGTRQGGDLLNAGYTGQWWLFAVGVLFLLVRWAQLEARGPGPSGRSGPGDAPSPVAVRAAGGT